MSPGGGGGERREERGGGERDAAAVSDAHTHISLLLISVNVRAGR